MTMTWLVAVLAILTVARLTRLVTADYVTAPIRDRLVARWGEDAKRSYLVTCDYCASIYVAVPVSIVAVLWGDNRVILIGLLALAASFVAGLTAQLDH